ncbi:MAG: biotin carboxylase [Ostreibacterium sp.]
MSKKLKGMSDIRRYFHRSDTPIYFVSPTNFNLLGMDEWSKNFKFINYLDCYDGRHPNTFVPTKVPHPEFESAEDINNYLLENKEVQEYIKSNGRHPKVVFLMFDEKTEALAKEAGLKVWFPKAKLRNRLDDKIETVRIGNKAGVPSVPNMLINVKNYQDLTQKTSRNLGIDLVIQTAHGHSGHTTYFVKNEDDFKQHEREITEAKEVKVMKRINCRGSAIEACSTKAGTIVGPLMTELVGFKDITPYKGGWCGNEIYSTAFTPEIRDKAREYTFKFGQQLKKEGYRGYFELDFLVDIDSNELYLGELNPRVTGASSMTNHAAFAHADAPLFLFHLLEFSGIDFELDVDEINARWSDAANVDSWSQISIKQTEDRVELITQAPETGIYRVNAQGVLDYSRFDYHRRMVSGENEAFFLRIAQAGDYSYKGADLGILITRGRLMGDRFGLNNRAKSWVKNIRSYYAGIPIEQLLPPLEVRLK